jgi:Flp pilus assembly protein TadG
MKVKHESSLRRALKDERGQVIPWVAFMMLMLLGMAAFVLDVGHAFFCYRQLQAATDAAALAGAKEIYYSTSIATATKYGGISAQSPVNAYSSTLNNLSMVPGWPKLLCVTAVANMGILCEGPNAANTIQVKEQATIPTFFAQVFGIKQMTLSATATATKGKPVPLNVALLMDTTLSMNSNDTSCGATQLGCAMTGAQTLLQGLAPSADWVSVFTFPNVDPATKQNDTQCTPPQSTNPGFPGSTPNAPGLATALPYTFPTLPSVVSTGYTVPAGQGTYQVTDFFNDFKNSNGSSSLNASSLLVAAVGQPATSTSQAVAPCLAPPNSAGVYGTFLAGVIYGAQAALAAEKAGETSKLPANSPTPVNVMILLSDGNPNGSTRYAGVSNQFFVVKNPSASGVYPSDVGDCGQAVMAATSAKGAGTLIFSIAYGSPATGSFTWNPYDVSGSINNAGCPTDQDSFFKAFSLGSNVSSYPNISPCQTMKDIASPSTATTQFFYSDYNQSGSNSQCYSPYSDAPTGLKDIFAAITGRLTQGRLIPDTMFN